MLSDRDLFDFLKMYLCFQWKNFGMSTREWAISIVAYPFLAPFILLFLVWCWFTFEEIRRK
jgi:hypothetical protein